MKKVILAVFLLSLAGCGPSQSELDQAGKRTLELEYQVKALKSELDDIKFGANQLLTKAKIASTSSSRGVTSLKAFLEYTETGHLHSTNVTGKSADSDFEVAVMQLLKQNGYDCEPQLGVAGFFLDLAVRDPGKPGRFLMGIECDGATYHSAKSAIIRGYFKFST